VKTKTVANRWAAWTVAGAVSLASHAALAGEPQGLLESVHKHTTLFSTVPDNGDLNPYAVVVAPVSVGIVQKGDVLVDNFNDSRNLQGLGTTIVDINPDSKKLTLFAQLPRDLAGCPGGVGLSTAMTMLQSGWVIVGSTPSQDGTTATKGPGCLIVLDPQGKVANVIAGPNVNDPWGNMAVVDKGTSATLFVSMAGFDIGAPKPIPPATDPPIVKEATVLRLELDIPAGKPPQVKSQTVIGSGFGAQADPGVFLIGPTGLSLAANDTLYVSDAIGNRVNAIRNASTRTTSAGIGRIVTQDGLLQRPLALCEVANGHLLAVNGLNGQVIEIDPASGKQLYAQWIDADKAQVPPGSGDLFGIAVTPDGKGFYYVEDDVNTLVLAK
jgi:hypothetical protein